VTPPAWPTLQPLPVQRPRIPIWIGGGYPNPRSTRRAARWDGSCLYKETHGGPWEHMTPDDVRALRTAAGDRPYTIAVGGSGRGDDWEAKRRHIRCVAEAGADWWIDWVPPSDPRDHARGRRTRAASHRASVMTRAGRLPHEPGRAERSRASSCFGHSACNSKPRASFQSTIACQASAASSVRRSRSRRKALL
jgi:hypothetical protein